MPNPPPPATPEPAAYLDMPLERRTAAIAHADTLSTTMRRIAAELPFQSDVDDFGRVLQAEAK